MSALLFVLLFAASLARVVVGVVIMVTGRDGWDLSVSSLLPRVSRSRVERDSDADSGGSGSVFFTPNGA